MIKYIEKPEEFEIEVKEGLVLVDFFATWCSPCRMLSPVLESIDGKMNDLKIIKIDVDSHHELASQFLVQSIPTIVLLKDGKEVARNIGFLPEPALSKFISKNK